MTAAPSRVDLDRLEAYIDAGYVRRQWTEDRSLQILNYTPKVQYDRLWDDITLLTRGLILRADGAIHARSFSKFFNLGEMPGPDIDKLPPEPPVITLKLDGYLGLSYWHGDTLKVASRGSFTSEYAQYATDWLRSHCPNVDNELRTRDFTLVFEILYPYRRIVVDNSDKFGLVLLAVIKNADGTDMDRSFVEALGAMMRIPVVPVYSTHTIEQCIALKKVIKGTEMEGFVAFYPKSGIRVKIKGDDYSKIHRIATKLTRRRVWEMLCWDGKGINPLPKDIGTAKIADIAAILPVEYADWVRQTAEDLYVASSDILCRAFYVAAAGNLDECKTREQLAEYLQKNCPDVWHEIMYLIDGKHHKAEVSAWKRICPAHELPILRDGDDE